MTQQFFYAIDSDELEAMQKVCAQLDLTCEHFSDERSNGNVMRVRITHGEDVSASFWIRFGETFRNESDVQRIKDRINR